MMSKMNCCPVCPLHHPEAQQMPDLHSCVGALADELLATRAAAESVRNYLNRIIVKVEKIFSGVLRISEMFVPLQYKSSGLYSNPLD